MRTILLPHVAISIFDDMIFDDMIKVLSAIRLENKLFVIKQHYAAT
jgi:hypothetical protein